jgi:hypothetical protein
LASVVTGLRANRFGLFRSEASSGLWALIVGFIGPRSGRSHRPSSAGRHSLPYVGHIDRRPIMRITALKAPMWQPKGLPSIGRLAALHGVPDKSPIRDGSFPCLQSWVAPSGAETMSREILAERLDEAAALVPRDITISPGV